LKVIQINTVCGTGSTGRITTDLSRVLESEGHQCCIAYGRGAALAGYDTIKIGSKRDVYYHVLYTRVGDRTGFASRQATEKFIEKIKAYNPDVIHLHNLHGYYINIDILFHYLASTDKPVVWTLHDCWAFTGHCAYFDYVNCNKWETGCFKCPQKMKYPASFVLDRSKENYTDKRELFTSVEKMIIVTPSDWLAALVRNSFLGVYPVQVIRNGIDLDMFSPTESNFRKRYGIGDKIMVLGVASGWDFRKGYQFFPEIADRLGEKYQVVLVGMTERQKSHLPKKIVGITRTNNVRELAGIYTAANVYVNPTLEDNFPTTNLEALACGTPVITFRTGGSAESIDETCGAAVEKGDIRALISQIHRLSSDPVIRNKCIKRARIFSKENMNSEYSELYKNMI
jgi:putative colanic acid biosynthesis glycosyltransferase